jgi:flagellar hook-basal body complex protein FliE
VTVPITPVGTTAPAPSSGSASAKASADFGASLRDLVGSVESSSTAANEAVEHMLKGTGDVHEAMIALQRAELTLQLTVHVRNKLVQAYQDIMRMPI